MDSFQRYEHIGEWLHIVSSWRQDVYGRRRGRLCHLIHWYFALTTATDKHIDVLLLAHIWWHFFIKTSHHKNPDCQIQFMNQFFPSSLKMFPTESVSNFLYNNDTITSHLHYSNLQQMHRTTETLVNNYISFSLHKLKLKYLTNNFNNL